MVMIGEIVSAGSGNGLELMVGKPISEMTPRCGKSVNEDVTRVVHPVDLEDGLQAPLVKAAVMCHDGEVANHRCNLRPDIREYRGVIRILGTETMHLLAEPLIVLRFWVDERVEGIHYPSAPNEDHANTANA